jgi:putative membrane protein
VLAVCISSLLTLRPGPLAGHMLLHILLMSVAAPLCAVGLVRHRLSVRRSVMNEWRAAPLWSATGLQMALLWAWHAPMLHAAAQSYIALRATMWVSLLLAATGFWAAVLLTPTKLLWQAMLALLVTGKLACLLGALLVFAPRQLYALHGMAHHAPPSLEDQQLAGLLMLVACPLTYVLAGILLAVKMMNGLPARRSPAPIATR